MIALELPLQELMRSNAYYCYLMYWNLSTFDPTPHLAMDRKRG